MIRTKTTKDDISGYLLFLEDVFPYMEKYHEENGMQRILRELSSLLEDTSMHRTGGVGRTTHDTGIGVRRPVTWAAKQKESWFIRSLPLPIG